MEAKPKELYDKMVAQVPYNGKNEEEVRMIAKRCALVAVDEFLIFNKNLYLNYGSISYQYWQDVKQEIEKM
jgi:hypothetical protein